ncbi:MAG: hypothetical protein HY343_12630 [Lentisphaerae bacterium]|nr:hypothetical protein [Lentisphaerota bacterium]
MRNKRPILLTFVLVGWILGILLPLYSARRFSPSYRVAFDQVFHTDASHVLMHTFLYAVLACLIAAWLVPVVRSDRRLIAGVLAGVAVVAMLQEAIQMVCEHVRLGSDELFDFFVDVNGGLLGFLIFFRWRQRIRGKGFEPQDPPAMPGV